MFANIIINIIKFHSFDCDWPVPVVLDTNSQTVSILFSLLYIIQQYLLLSVYLSINIFCLPNMFIIYHNILFNYIISKCLKSVRLKYLIAARKCTSQNNFIFLRSQPASLVCVYVCTTARCVLDSKRSVRQSGARTLII